ncbi:MAG: lytic transglycosylase domain-containing protein [Pseudomonadota bacterium]
MHRFRRFVGSLLLVPLLLVSNPEDSRASGPSQTDIALLSQSLDLVDRGQSFAAWQLIQAAQSQLVRDLVLYFDLMREDSSADFATIASLLARHPDWPRRARVARKAEAALLAMPAGQAQVIAFFSRNPPQSGAAALTYLAALEAQGDQLGAERAVRAVWRDVLLDEAEESGLLTRYRRSLQPDDHLQRFLMLVDEEQSDAVQQGNLVGPGYAQLASARLALKARRSGALGQVNAVPSNLRRDSLLIVDQAGYYQRTGRQGQVDALLLEIGAPNAGVPEELWRLRFSAVHRNLRNGNSRQAYLLARDHGLFSGGGFAELEWKAGFIALERLRDPAAAYAHFVRYYEGSAASPISKGKAAYWAARAAEAMGRGEEAKAWLAAGAAEETSFYGQLSAARIGLLPGAGLPLQPALPADFLVRYQHGDLAQAFTALARAGERWRTNLFFASLRRGALTPSDLQALASLSSQYGRTDLQVKSAKSARRMGSLLINDLFPRPAAIGAGVPERALVLALTRQESEFNEAAISRADARGLMQLLPSTARGVAGRLGLPYSRGRLTSDPAYNVTLGRAYLQQRIQQFTGSYLLALTSYNAGAHRSDTWIGRNGDPRSSAVDFVLWVEAIPFAETRNYVMRVLEGLVVYRNLLGDTNPLGWQGYNPAGQGANGARQTFCCQ